MRIRRFFISPARIRGVFSGEFGASYKSSIDDYGAAITSETAPKRETLKTQMRYRHSKCVAMTDSGRPTRIIKNHNLHGLKTDEN